jgi:N-acetylmuramoyl-L-alanine amidase
MAFKIALTAGHYMGTSGKRCMKKLDKKQTREWYLNDRIADKVEKLLKNYTGYQLIRTDDTTGKKDISLTARTNAANNFKADFYLSIHHNAGVKGGKGGGIVAIVYNKTTKAESIAWQKDLYRELIAATGLKGNRATPLAKMNLHEVRETKMPAVLLELGFMDSATDVPIILTEKFADQCAEAIVKVLVKRGGLKKKVVEQKKPVEQETSDKIYRVQVGAYRDKDNAEAMLKKLKSAGFDATIV